MKSYMRQEQYVKVQHVLALTNQTPTIVAVTKTYPFEIVKEAYGFGFRHFGENRAEEAQAKIKEARAAGLSDIVWHMVGHVQGRKAKCVVELFDWVDSIDSIKIARKLNDAAGKLNKTMNILWEINLSGDSGKYGVDLLGWERDKTKLNYFAVLIDESLHMENLVVEGFMTMTPCVTDPEENRLIFRSMRKLSDTIREQFPEFGRQLSMGTSCDYLVAASEGATMIRLGEALFGKRR